MVLVKQNVLETLRQRILRHKMDRGEWLIMLVIIWYVFADTLTNVLKLPKVLPYLGDLVNMYVFGYALLHRKSRYRSNKKNNWPLIFMITFAMIGLASSVTNRAGVILTLWGCRQSLRYFLFFYSCCSLFNVNSLDYFLTLVKWLFWISCPLCFYEAFFFKVSSNLVLGDTVGGIYYGFFGVNAALNILLITHSAVTIIRFLDNKCGMLELIVTLGAAMFMSSCAELKVFLLEVVMIAGIAMIRKGPDRRVMLLAMVGVVGLIATVSLFVFINARGRRYYTTDMFSISGLLHIATDDAGYIGNGDLTHLNAISRLYDMFFENDLFRTLFGYGIGNADYSSGFEMLQSKFYVNYGYLHYYWFMHAFVFVETGFAGLAVFVLILLTAYRAGKKHLAGNRNLQTFYYIQVLLMIVLLPYNQEMRAESCAYTLYFLLAIPFMYKNFGGRLRTI